MPIDKSRYIKYNMCKQENCAFIVFRLGASCFGGRMDKKIRLALSMQYENEVVANSIVSGLMFEHLLDNLRELMAETENISKSDIYEGLQNIASDGARVDYASLNEWTNGKDYARDELLALAVILSRRDSDESGKPSGIVQRVSDDMAKFASSVSKVEFSNGFALLKDSGVPSEMVEKVLEEMSIVSENEFMIAFMDEDLKYEPLDTKPHTNSFIEKKLKKLSSVVSKLSLKIDSDYASLQNMVVDMEKKLYGIATSVSTDTEKTELANRALKSINSHKQLVDKVEDGLVDATELARQLAIHSGKLKEAEGKELEEMNASGVRGEVANKNLLAKRVANGEYRSKIDDEKIKLDALKLKVERHRKIVEGVEMAFRSAIPTETELKKYSSIKHRLQDLQNRLAIAGSQVVLNNDTKELLDANKAGLETLVQIYIDGKDLFIRNTLMSGVFSSVNALYSLGENKDKAIEKSNKKFIGAKLLEYSIQNSSLQKDLRTFRRIGDEVVRDVAIVLGKPITLSNLKEMAEIQELAVHQSSQMLEMLDKNHKNEVELLTSILNI